MEILLFVPAFINLLVCLYYKNPLHIHQHIKLVVFGGDFHYVRGNL